MSYVQVWNCTQCGRENEQTIQCTACKAYIPRDNDAVRWELRPGPLIKASSETGKVTLAHQTTKEFLATLDHNENIEHEIPASVEAADRVLVASQKQQKILEDPDGGASVISTTSDSLDSVFSVESSDTLAPALTRESAMDLSKGEAGNIDPERCWRCGHCDWVSAYPRRVCPECGTVNGEWMKPLSPTSKRRAHGSSSPSHGTATTQWRPSNDELTIPPALYTAYTQGDTLQEKEVSHLYGHLLEGGISPPRKDASLLPFNLRVRGREPSPHGRIPLQDDSDQKDSTSIASTTQELSSRRNGPLQDEPAQEDRACDFYEDEYSPRRPNPLQHEADQEQHMSSVPITQEQRSWIESRIREESYQKVDTSTASLASTSQELTPKEEVPPQDEFEQQDNMSIASIASIASTSQESVFSEPSLQTSASIYSEQTGFSVAQIQHATREFVSLLQEDEFLVLLYEKARKSPSIGTRRLRRELRERLKVFAKNLQDEAKDHLEFAASRLVRVRARFAAQCVADHHSVDRNDPPGRTNEPENSKQGEDSSDEETEEQPLNEREYVDLNAFSSFLAGSDALVTLREEMQAFCTSKAKPSFGNRGLQEKGSISALECTNQYTWLKWRDDLQELNTTALVGLDATLMVKMALFLALNAVFLMTDNIFVALGWLEPVLEAGWTRIRIESSCGDRFFDDFIEQRTDGIEELLREMRHSLPSFSFTAVPYNHGFSVQQYTAKISTWLHRVSNNVVPSLPWHDHNHTGLPQHNVSGTATTASITPSGVPQQRLNTVHLMSCVHRNRNDPALLQTDICTVRNDQALFSLLRTKISHRRNRLLRILSCRSIQGIYFTKFHLHSNDHVDIRDHKQSCPSMPSTTSCCECLPPVHIIEPFPNAEYRCDIPCPPGTWPPIGSNTLLRMLKSPANVDKKSTWILHRAPKRVVGELSANGDQPADGWGFYFQEGWDFDLIITISFVVLILGSLLFGVCWSVLEHDIQGAFGVSAYMVTACGLFVAFVVSKTG